MHNPLRIPTDSPGFGSSGKHLTSRHIRDRFLREVQRGVARSYEEIGEGSFKVSGRGVLHPAVLIETMRREGYELTISRPRVIVRTIDGVRCEPTETLVVDTTDATTGPVIDAVGRRQGLMTRMHSAAGRIFFSPLPLSRRGQTVHFGENGITNRKRKTGPFDEYGIAQEGRE